MSAKIDKILPLLKIKVLSLQVYHSVYVELPDRSTGSLNQTSLLVLVSNFNFTAMFCWNTAVHCLCLLPTWL